MVSYEDAIELADEMVSSHDFDLERVPKALQVVYLISALDFELNVNGVHGWLTNSSGRHASETVAALEAIGAEQCAALVARMLTFFPGGVPARDQLARGDQVTKLLPLAKATWDELSARLLEWPDDVDALLRSYIETHADQFTRA